MKILVFLHGTLIMQKSAAGHTRKEIVKQVINKEKSVFDYASYIPIGDAVKKLNTWKKQGAKIVYLSSHENLRDAKKDSFVLKKFKFPLGPLLFRQRGQTYASLAEKIMPNILIEDDCESIGGKVEMTFTFIQPELKKKIKHIVVKEFSGVDHLPEKISALIKY